jgi:hypothetical protein
MWHEEFAPFTTLVAFWVDEAMRTDGIDLCNRGGDIALSTLTYVALTALLPRHQIQPPQPSARGVSERRSR